MKIIRLIGVAIVVVALVAVLYARTEFAGAHDESSAQTNVLRLAKRDWPKFLVSFRSALKRRDRSALRAMTSPEVGRSCTYDQVGDVRRWLFETDIRLDILLDIIIPGRSPRHTDITQPIVFDRDRAIVTKSISDSCGFGLDFEYGPNTGWLVTHFHEPCEGC